FHGPLTHRLQRMVVQLSTVCVTFRFHPTLSQYVALLSRRLVKGRSTLLREKAVCTWGWRGTRRLWHRAARIANALLALSKARASLAWLRQPWMGVAHEP
ncbi:MAG: hypothetical protein M0R28_00005, partial [Pigmentiphaga sp.]|nr:hypothetical protein [Pigmentiphaga sp.]